MTISEPSPDPASKCNEVQEPGLWLWHGEVLPVGETPALSETPARVPRWSRLMSILQRLFSAAEQCTRWLEPSRGSVLGLAFIGAAAWTMVYLLSGGGAVLRATSAIAFSPAQSTEIERPANAVLPAPVPVQLRPAPIPTVPTTRMVAEPPVRNTIAPPAAHRSRVVKRAQAKFIDPRIRLSWKPCRYYSDCAEPMTWHGGGY